MTFGAFHIPHIRRDAYSRRFAYDRRTV